MSIRTLLLVFLATVTVSNHAQTIAGKTMVARGKVNASAENSTNTRKLKRRAPVYDNDVVTTGEKGKAQIRMTDGGMIALKANSELIIADYEFTEENGEGSVVMELVKGGLRSVTGAIKAKSGDYKLKTPVGSIGIRGTHYEVEIIDGQMFLAVWDGAIDVSVETGNEAGTTLSLGDGEDYSYAAIDAEGNVTEFIDPPENFESGMSSETDDSETEEEQEEQEESEQESTESDEASDSNDEQSSDEKEDEQPEDSEEQESKSSEEPKQQDDQEEKADAAESDKPQSTEQNDDQDESSEQNESQTTTNDSSASSNRTPPESNDSTTSEPPADAGATVKDAAPRAGDTDTPAATVVTNEPSVLDTQVATESLVETELDQDSSFDASGQDLGATTEAADLVEDESFLATDDFNVVEPDTTAELIADRSGSFTYRQLSSFEGTSSNGAIRNFQVFIAIDFDTLGVTAGDMTFDDDLGQWRGSFTGNITADGAFNLDFNHASHGNNLADGEIDAAFFDGIDSIIGNFTLQEILNPDVNSNGSFIIK